MTIKCIIVDDEPHAQRVLEKYIESVSVLKLIKKCNNALEAVSCLYKNDIDLIFLDIKMPEIDGLQFLKTLHKPPQIIITTAFSEFALQGYELSVVDYLLKPFSFDRFLMAINKVTIKNKVDESSVLSDVRLTNEFIFLKTDKVNHKILLSEIKYFSGFGNYVKVFTDKKAYLVSETLSKIEKNLPSDLFLRTHKSYIVSIQRIKQIEGNRISIDDQIIPIGNYYRKYVLAVTDKYKLTKEDNPE